MSQVAGPVLAASITGTVSLTVGVLAYIFGRLQKEHEVRFTRLYERRADVVADLYTKLHKLSVGFETWYSHHDSGQTDERDAQTQPLRDELDEFRDYYLEKDIWLSEGTFGAAKGFYDEASGTWVELDRPMSPEDEEKVAAYVEGWVQEALPRLKEKLKYEFREVLGISDNQTRNEGTAVLYGWWRMVIGLAGTSLVGVALGLIFGYFTGDYCIGLLAGFLAGLGLGLFIQYLRPPRHRPS